MLEHVSLWGLKPAILVKWARGWFGPNSKDFKKWAEQAISGNKIAESDVGPEVNLKNCIANLVPELAQKNGLSYWGKQFWAQERVPGGPARQVKPLSDSEIKLMLFDAVSEYFGGAVLTKIMNECWHVIQYEGTRSVVEGGFNPGSISPCGFKEEDGVFFHVFPSLDSGPYPAWNEFLKRLSAPKTFCSIVGSIMDRNNRGRRVLWLTGTGNDGKSRALEAIKSFFGPVAKNIDSNREVDKDRFWMAQFEGVRLGLVMDNKSPTLLQSGAIKGLTGGDALIVERKNKDPYEATNHCSVIIASNVEPQISDENSLLSRLVPITVAPLADTSLQDDTWPKRLEKELPSFMGYCWRLYKASGVIIEDVVKEQLRDSVEVENHEFQILFDGYFSLDDGARTTSLQIEEVLLGTKWSHKKKQDFKRWLERQDGVSKGNMRIGTKVLKGFFGIKRAATSQ
jgi:hypothetical protein